MAGLTNEGEELALNLLFRNTGEIPTNVYLGLATASIDDTDTLSSITEENDANYNRQEINFSAPEQISGDGTIKNNSEIVFGPWSADADNPITHAFITDASSGTTGKLLSAFELPESKQPSAEETTKVPLEECVQSIN